MKVLEKSISTDAIRPELCHVHIINGYIYATDQFTLLRINANNYPNLTLNLKDGEHVALDKKMLKLMSKKDQYIISKDEVRLVDKKKGTLVLKPADITYGIISNIERVIKDNKIDNFKNGWNIDGLYYDPTYLCNIMNVAARVENTDKKAFHINTTEKGIAVITLDGHDTDDFIGICMNVYKAN